MVNNPSNLNLSKSYSTISNTLANPFLAYGNFNSSDPIIADLLPKNLNLGITSPEYIDNETSCTGLDYIKTDIDYDKLPFKVCLDKFYKEYEIPEMTFNNLMKDLPYTFDKLSKEEQKKYLNKIKEFVKKVSPNSETFINKEYFEDKKEYFGQSQAEKNPKNKMNNKLLCYLIIIILILIIASVSFI
jgi:hypothetical protein